MQIKTECRESSAKPTGIQRHAIFLIAAIALVIFTGCGSLESDEFNLGFKIYVPNLADNTITVIPKEKSKESDIIDLDKNPQFLARVPSEDTVFCLLSGANEILEINSSSDEKGDIFLFEIGSPQPQSNFRVLFNSSGQKAYFLTSYTPAALAVMKVSDRSFERGFDFGSTSIENLYFNSDGSRLYCPDPSVGKIYVINALTDDRLTDINVPESFSLAVYDPSTDRFFLAESGTLANIKIYDPATDTFTQRYEEVTDNIVKMTKSDDGSRLYVLGSDELVIINLDNDVIDERITLEYRSPSDFVILPDNKYIVIPSTSSDLLMFLDPGDYTTEEIIDTGSSPGEILVIE